MSEVEEKLKLCEEQYNNLNGILRSDALEFIDKSINLAESAKLIEVSVIGTLEEIIL